MKAVIIMATPCPKSLHGKGDTADACDDGEEVSRVRLRYPKHLMSYTIELAHTLTPSHTVRCLDCDTAGDCIRMHLGVHAGAGACARTLSRRCPTGGMSLGINTQYKDLTYDDRRQQDAHGPSLRHFPQKPLPRSRALIPTTLSTVDFNSVSHVTCSPPHPSTIVTNEEQKGKGKQAELDLLNARGKR